MAGSNPAFEVASSVMLATTTTSARIAIMTSGDTAVVTNFAAGNLYINWGGSSITAATNAGSVLLPNQQRVVACPSGASYFAAVLDSGTGNVYVERGYGSAR